MSRRPFSLKTRLIVQPLILQFLTLVASAGVLVLLILHSSVNGMYADDVLVHVAAKAIVRDAQGHAVVRETPALDELRKDSTDLWFAAKLDDGSYVTYGTVPDALRPLLPHLDAFTSADFRGKSAPYTTSAVVRHATGPAGNMMIAAHGIVRPLTLLIALASNLIAVPLFLALALVSIVATPWIVRRALAGVVRTAREAENIKVGSQGIRLPEDQLPREITPLVRAVNDALGRLDDGHEQQRRFIASAAHELRTPIAILRMKVEASSDPALRGLAADVSRLSTLSEQLLDLHRLENGAPFEAIDPAAIARRVAADLAPLLIAADKSIEVVTHRPAPISGNAGAIERVLTNLIQNAVEHGGKQITVRVEGSTIEVEDNGAGIPADERERVFEAFHRLRPRSSGTGLGLHLVQQVMSHHKGHASILDASDGGTLVRVTFPPAPSLRAPAHPPTTPAP
ncbi:HAMP domain-containing histidine kinase [Bacillus sp. NP157]|nr:HAMP domain-containing histidine kinase [Bacillus sp. NP157]